VVLDVTARQADGKTLYQSSKTWFELGLDATRRMRYGSWQIKDIIDLTLPPLQTQRDRHLMHFDSDTREVTIDVGLRYFLSADKEAVVHSHQERLTYPPP
jgi:hypothetical protein